MSDLIANLVVSTASDYINLEKKMENLKRKLERLNCDKDDMDARLRVEERHPGKRRKSAVTNWLNAVVSKQKDFESLKAEVNQNNRISRVNLAKRVDEMIEEVTELLDRGTFSEVVVLDVSDQIKFVIAAWEGKAFKKNFQTVWKCLLGNDVSRIGVYGMGGVGKTTLVQCIHNELKKEAMFSGDVFWVTVSQDLNIDKLQNDIGKALNLDLSSEDDEHKRAAMLGWALETKKGFVLMLDDVWTPFSLHKIGISPSLAAYGFKIVVISRSMEVCRKMECQAYLKVKVLSEEEAWKLFMNKLSYGIQLSPEVEEIAREVVKKCAGLPLAIITMAGSLRGEVGIHEWRDALEELKMSCMEQDDMENEVFPILLCSFNRLRDPILKRCFLYCSLYPEDFLFERNELINNFISEQLMERRTSRQAYFDQGHKILDKLENVCLLERCFKYGSRNAGVKMHDLIRDMALKITKDICMVKAGLQLKDIPGEQEWKEDLYKVSLMSNNIESISSVISHTCPKLSTLLLSYNPLKSIPDSIFLQMRGLHVLNLSRTNIEYLPSSISSLEQLNALLLGWCKKLMFVSPLGNLKALKELDLSGTIIEEMPRGVESLTNLECLDTIGSNIKTIPIGGLSLLQHLSVPSWITIPIEEVAGLKQLEEFEGRFCNVHDFNIFMKSRPIDGKLSFYNIKIDHKADKADKIDFWDDEFHLSEGRTLAKKLVTFEKDSLKGGEGEIMLPRNIERVKFFCCGLSSCLSDDFQKLNNPKELKRCYIFREDGIECIVRLSHEKELIAEEGQQSSLMPLHYLENLFLIDLKNFIGLIGWKVAAAAVAPLPSGTFSHLQELKVINCGKIKKLLPRSLVQNLHNLEELAVRSCAQMEDIIGDDEIDGGLGTEGNTFFNLSRLKILHLDNLPELVNICKETIICDSIEEIVIQNVKKVRKMPLFLPLLNGQPTAPPSLKHINILKDERRWWESLEWDQPNANIFLQPFVSYRSQLYVNFIDIGFVLNFI